MKLEVVSKGVSFSILFFILLAVIVGIWGWVKLNQPYQISQNYQQYRSVVNNDVRVLLERYLRSSDATFLQEAEARLDELSKKDLVWLNESENNELKTEMGKIKNQIQEVRAAGKLSASPQMLLIHNERERIADIRLLLTYIKDIDIELKLSYLERLEQINAAIIAMSHLRQKYFETNEAKLKQNLVTENSKISVLIDELKHLPRLGIYSEVDEDALIPEEPEALEMISLDSLSSLTHRYAKELSNSEALMKKISTSREILQASLKLFSEKLDLFGERIDSIKENITSDVKFVLIPMLFILFMLISASYLLMLKSINFLNHIESFLRNMVNGDFTQVLEGDGKYEEISSVKSSGMKLEQHLESIINRLQKQAQDVLKNSKNAQSISEQASELTTYQSESTEKVAISVSDLSHSFQDVADNALMASESACAADHSTSQAREKLLIATENTRKLGSDILSMETIMTQLQNDGENINSVLEVIHGIADQTNLLALNAAIEAARAGEQGRGFAVVADEVRLLAQRTAQSTDQIKGIIDKLVSATTNAGDAVKKHSNSAMECVNHTNEAMHAMDPVVTAVANITEMNTDIAAATKRQANMVDEIARSTDAMKTNSAMVGKNMNIVQESGESLFLVSEALNQMISELRESEV